MKGDDEDEGRLPRIDAAYLEACLLALLEIPSPTGYTDNVVHYAAAELEALGVSCEVTRRGAVRGVLPGETSDGKRAVVAHLDTLGAMVTRLKSNGRLAVAPIGTWSSRFAEGARCTLFTDVGSRRGTLLPVLASGHTYGDDIDRQPVSWDHVEMRVDEHATSRAELEELEIHAGDYIAVDATAEVTPAGYLVSRHLDDKGGVALLLAMVKALRDGRRRPAVDTHVLFTISEEVGSGASAVLHGDVASMVAVEIAPPALDQSATERGVTIGMMDSSGPFDYHLSHRLLELCRREGILHTREVFRNYRCDAASAIEAGNDIRTAVVGFGVDASHGYERTHMESLVATTRLLVCYALEAPLITRDRHVLAGLGGFPHVPEDEADPVELFDGTPPRGA